MMRHTEELQSSLYAEMLSHIQQTDLTVPVKRGRYFYYTAHRRGKQYRITAEARLARRREEIFGRQRLAEGHKYFRSEHSLPSPNHKLLATQSIIPATRSSRFPLKTSRPEQSRRARFARILFS